MRLNAEEISHGTATDARQPHTMENRGRIPSPLPNDHISLSLLSVRNFNQPNSTCLVETLNEEESQRNSKREYDLQNFCKSSDSLKLNIQLSI